MWVQDRPLSQYSTRLTPETHSLKLAYVLKLTLRSTWGSVSLVTNFSRNQMDGIIIWMDDSTQPRPRPRTFQQACHILVASWYWHYLTGVFFPNWVFVVAVQKRQITEPEKVLVEAFSLVLFSDTYGAQTKGIDDFMHSVIHALNRSAVCRCHCLSYSLNKDD